MSGYPTQASSYPGLVPAATAVLVPIPLIAGGATAVVPFPYAIGRQPNRCNPTGLSALVVQDASPSSITLFNSDDVVSLPQSFFCEVTPDGVRDWYTGDQSGDALLPQAQLDAINVNTPQSVQIISPVAAMYMVTIYIASRQDGDNTQVCQPHIFFTDFVGLGQRDFAPVLGPITGGVETFNSQNFSVPFYSKAGTPIIVSTTFGGAYSFHYDFGARIVNMPQPIM